jgi:flagellar hook-associated protein 3 FlgL
MTTRITSSMMARHSLGDIDNNANRLDRATRELSSQKRILQASDDPIGTQRAINARAELASNTQYQTNISQAQGVLATSDTALSDVADLLRRARDLTVQAANDTVDAESRKSIALEIDQIAAQLKTVGNTTFGGVYVFSGTATTTRPYDTTTVPPVDAYSGDAGSMAREIGPGVSVAVNTQLGSGDPPILGRGGGTDPNTGLSTGDGGLLATLRTLADNLRAGTPAASNALKTTDLAALDRNLDTVTAAQASVGATVNRLDAAHSRLEANNVASTDLLSDTEDVDFAQATINYSTAQTVYQASLAVGAKIIQPSLLDFLAP